MDKVWSAWTYYVGMLLAWGDGAKVKVPERPKAPEVIRTTEVVNYDKELPKPLPASLEVQQRLVGCSGGIMF